MTRIIWGCLWTMAGIAGYLAVVSSYQANPWSAPCLVASLLLLGLGVLVLRQNLHNRLYRSFFWLSLAFSSFMLLVYLLHLATAVGLARVRLPIELLRNGNLLIPPCLIHFTNQFVGRNGWGWRLATRLSLASMLPFVVLNLAGRYIVSYRLMEWRYIPDQHRELYMICGLITTAWVFFSAVVVVGHCFLPGHRERRRQYLGFLAGWIFAAIPCLLGFLPAFHVNWFPSFIGVGTSAFPLILGLTILRYGVFDIKLVVRRTIPYALVTALIGCAYGLVLLGLEHQASRWALLPRGAEWLILLIITGVLFQPVLEETRKIIDWAFFRREVELDRFIAHAPTRYLLAESPAELFKLARQDLGQMLEVEDALLLGGRGQVEWLSAGRQPGDWRGRSLEQTRWREWRREDADSARPGDPRLDELRAAGAEVAVAIHGAGFCLILAMAEKKSHLPFNSRDLMFLRALGGQLESALAHLLARQEAHQAQQLILATFAAMQSGLVLADAGGTIRDCNPAFEQLSGFKTGEPIPAELAGPAPAGADDSAVYEKELAQRKYLVCRKRVPRDDEAPWQLLIFTEITELVNLRNAISQREALSKLGMAISAINHEIHNILSPVRYYLNKLKQGAGGADEQKFTGAIESRIDLLDTLTRELREYYREPVLNLRPLNLATVIESSLADLAAIAGPGWQAPACSGLDQPLHADPQRIKQIFLNLLKNSWEAMAEREPKTWQVDARRDGQTLVVEIRDSGCGIPEQVLSKLFEPFVTTKTGTGTGLGLAITRRLIEAHHGRIEISSEKDRGTQVRLTFADQPAV